MSPCYQNAPDGGWYECEEHGNIRPRFGNKISVRSERTDIGAYHMWTIRAYNGINVLTKDRILVSSDSNAYMSLFRPFPRSMDRNRKPMKKLKYA